MSSAGAGPRLPRAALARKSRGGAWLGVLLVLLTACGDARRAGPSAADLAAGPWEDVVLAAEGTRVVWRMWRGDPSINAFVDEWVAPRVRDRYGIELIAVEGSGQELVNQLAVERQAEARGASDLLWINGETFHNLRRMDLLDGPWSGSLPNSAAVDSTSPIIARDFEQDPAGFESPWGRVQFALIYDARRTPDPPRSFADLGLWILENPGRFTHDQSFTGITFLKMLMYSLGGGVEAFQGGFDEESYAVASERVWRWVEMRRDAFWRSGLAYPQEVAELHRLFANGEVDFSMSNNENEVITKVRQGTLPSTARPLLLRDGTIANTHFVGIAFNAPNPAGAMLVADFLLSPEAQLQKLRPEVWADGTVLDVDRLDPEWRERFADVADDPRALSRDSLRRYAVPEVAPEYHERLASDWRSRIRDRP
ncbi:MAG: ABC transporter substrate-binding protein [Gemmatimonadota bacterium]